MVTKTQINSEILRMNQFIEKEYPELANFPLEFTVTNPDTNNPIINIKNLLNYYESLILMVKHYKKARDLKTTIKN